MHNITQSLERLPSRVAQGESANFFVVGQHKNVSTGSIHGFGVVIEISDKGEANQFLLRLMELIVRTFGEF